MHQQSLRDRNYLAHYGVLGMRWGVHRGDSSGSRGSGIFRKRVPSADAEKAGSLRKKSLKELSNEDLRVLNARLQLEKQYKSLKKRDIIAGEKIVTDILAQSGKELAKDYVKGHVKTLAPVAGAWVLKKTGSALVKSMNARKG